MVMVSPWLVQPVLRSSTEGECGEDDFVRAGQDLRAAALRLPVALDDDDMARGQERLELIQFRQGAGLVTCAERHKFQPVAGDPQVGADQHHLAGAQAA
jgi:hypothetical protein